MRRILALLFPALSYYASFGQWSGSTSSTDYVQISRNGNIMSNTLGFGRYGSPWLGETNAQGPYNIYAAGETGSKELLIFGNGTSTSLSLRLFDGDFKVGENQTAPGAMIYNNGTAYFTTSLDILGTRALPTNANAASATNTTNYAANYGLKVKGGNSALYITTSTAFNERKVYLQSGHSDPLYAYGTGSISLNPFGGNVGIGTTQTDAKLTVNGDIHAKEVRVDLNVPGPDYVFENDYDLRTLGEVEKYINENKHLPEIPSAKEMEKNGINVVEMNMLLLKKVEELTLYMIQLEKKNHELEIKNATLQEKNSEFQGRLDALESR